MLAIYAGRDRAESQFRGQLMVAWMLGKLSQCSLDSYPTLDSILDEDAQPQVAEEQSKARMVDNGFAWIAEMNAMNAKANPPPTD